MGPAQACPPSADDGSLANLVADSVEVIRRRVDVPGAPAPVGLPKPPMLRYIERCKSPRRPGRAKRDGERPNSSLRPSPPIPPCII